MALPVTQPVVFFIPNGSGGTDTIQMDACITESYSVTNTLTDHPVEQGANITDHSRPEPIKITLDCSITNTPISNGNNQTSTGLLAPDQDYAFAMWRRFVDLHNNPRLIDVLTARDKFLSYGIESVSSTLDVKSAQCFRFTVGIKEIRVVKNKFTNTVVSKVPKAQVVYRLGGVQTEEAAPTSVANDLDIVGKAEGLLNKFSGK